MSLGGALRRASYWTADFFKGSPVGRHMRDMKHILNNGKSGRLKQKGYIDALLLHATEHSEFYKPYRGRELLDFPVVNKNILTQNRDRVKVDIRYIPEQKTEKIHEQRTSGSTGRTFAVLQDTRKRNRRLAALKYFGELAGYRDHECLAQCRIWNVLRGKSKRQSFRENILPINVSVLNDEALAELCETMHRKKASALLGYGGWMEILSEYLKRYPQKFPHLKVIISSAEMLKSNVREDLKNQLGCDVLERYANEEEGVLGQQTADSTCYYLNHASYYFEILKLESDEPAEYGELGRIVVTDLFNYVFPLIRYDTGDVGIMSEYDENSNGYPVLKELYGRRADIIYDTKGTAIHPISFSTIFKSRAFIEQWQLIQKGEKQFTARLSVSKIPEKAEEESLAGHIKGVLGADAELQFEYVDDIPVLSSGKRKSVVCEWERK